MLAPADADMRPGPDADPDSRFTFATERMFLARNRTALALIASGLAVAQLVKVRVQVASLVAALALMLFGVGMSAGDYRHWQRNERVLRLGQPVTPSALLRFLANGVTGFAAAAAVLVVVRLVA